MERLIGEGRGDTPDTGISADSAKKPERRQEITVGGEYTTGRTGNARDESGR